MTSPPEVMAPAPEVTGFPTLDEVVRTRVRDELVDAITTEVDGLPPGEPLEVSLVSLRRAHSCPEAVGQPESAFVWKPAFARRSLGLAAVRACAEERFRGPAEAVGPLADRAVEEWRRTGWRTFHWEPWFAGLGEGARAAVLAEATSWATPLWASADWVALGRRADIGGPDDLWTCPGARTVRLKGRWEARVSPASDGASGSDECHAGHGPALVSVSGGSPGAGWAEELGFLALVAGLQAADRPVASRVVGLWPESGMRRTVGIDGPVLAAAAERAVATVSLVVRARRTRPAASDA